MTIVNVENATYGDSLAIAHKVSADELTVAMQYVPPLGAVFEVAFERGGRDELVMVTEVTRTVIRRKTYERVVTMRVLKYIDRRTHTVLAAYKESEQ